MRATLVATTVAAPSLLLTGSALDAPEIIVFIAFLAGVFVFAEYNTAVPSILEFRDAPPLNRLRFLSFSLTVIALTMISKHVVFPTTLTGHIASIGDALGQFLDFPYSPVRLVTSIVSSDAAPVVMQSVRSSAAMAYVISVVAVALFLLAVRVKGWPTRNGAFNVWTNLPLFDPTAGRDVVDRLNSEARLHIIVGIVMPFVLPALLLVSTRVLEPIALSDPFVLIWTISAWAIVPTYVIMRGIAFARVASLIEEKRRRAYAMAEAEGVQTA